MNLPGLVADRLIRMGVPSHFVERESHASSPVQVGPTRDRAIVRILVNFGHDLTDILSADGWDETDFGEAESALAETPCRASSKGRDAIFPCDAAPAPLKQKCGAGLRHKGRSYRPGSYLRCVAEVVVCPGCSCMAAVGHAASGSGIACAELPVATFGDQHEMHRGRIDARILAQPLDRLAMRLRG